MFPALTGFLFVGWDRQLPPALIVLTGKQEPLPCARAKGCLTRYPAADPSQERMLGVSIGLYSSILPWVHPGSSLGSFCSGGCIQHLGVNDNTRPPRCFFLGMAWSQQDW